MKKHIAAFVAVLLCLGCTLPLDLGSLFEDQNEAVEDTGENAQAVQGAQAQTVKYEEFSRQVEASEISIVEINGSETSLGFTGPVMDLVIQNEKDQAVEIEIPCGLIFSPGNDDTQRMMVVQPLTVLIPAGESAEVHPFVVCIDSSKGGPTPEDSFTVGVLAEGGLLQMADCLCREDLAAGDESMDLAGVQYAVWAVADENFTSEDVSLEELFAQPDGELPPEVMQSMEEFQTFMETFDTGTDEWLEKCGITDGE